MGSAAVRLSLLALLLAPVGACSGTSSASACSKAIDGLSVNIETARNAQHISSDAVTASFDACGDASTWGTAADSDHIGTSLGFKPDMESPLLTTGEAFDYFCSHFAGDNSTGGCNRR